MLVVVRLNAYGTTFWSIKAEIGTCRRYRHLPSIRPVSGDGIPISTFIDQKAVSYAYLADTFIADGQFLIICESIQYLAKYLLWTF